MKTTGSKNSKISALNARERKFIATVWSFYANNKRSFPWRKTTNPYRILVSEIMLQQTQTYRVVPKYEAFMKKFPTPAALARASLADVLSMWQGLGYNRRARYLKQAAEALVARGATNFPNTYDELVSLPGIGPYTAAAVLAFAFNIPVPLIETNIRAAYIHHFFPREEKVRDDKLKPIIARTLDTKNPREWYAALMDYGSHLKILHGNPSRKSAHHTKQSQFKGSTRQVRGAVIKLLLNGNPSGMTDEQLGTQIENARILSEDANLSTILEKLERDGIIKRISTRVGAKWQIA